MQSTAAVPWLLSTLVTIGLWNPLASARAATATASAEDWREVLVTLAAVDDRVAAGRSAEAAAELAVARKVWKAPFSELAARYLRLLDDGTVPASDSFGVELLAEALADSENPEIRSEVEDFILGLGTARHDAAVQVLLARGNRAFEKGDLPIALENYERASRQHPNARARGRVTYNAGIALSRLGRHEEAMAAFQHLLAMGVNNAEESSKWLGDAGHPINYEHRAALKISWSLEQLGRFSEAYRWAELARTTYPYVPGWCQTAVDEERLFQASVADRLAWSAGGGLALRHFARVLRTGWCGLALWIGALLGLAVVRWWFSAGWPVLVHSAAVAAVIISVICGVVDRIYSSAIFELDQVLTAALAGGCVLLPVLAIRAAFWLRQRQPITVSRAAAAAVIGLAIAFLAWLTSLAFAGFLTLSEVSYALRDGSGAAALARWAVPLVGLGLAILLRRRRPALARWIAAFVAIIATLGYLELLVTVVRSWLPVWRRIGVSLEVLLKLGYSILAPTLVLALSVGTALAQGSRTMVQTVRASTTATRTRV